MVKSRIFQELNGSSLWLPDSSHCMAMDWVLFSGTKATWTQQAISILWNIKSSWDWPSPLPGSEQSQGANLKIVSDLFVGTCLIGKMMMQRRSTPFIPTSVGTGCQVVPFLSDKLQPCWKGVHGFLSKWGMGGTHHPQGSPQLPQWCCMRSWILCPEAWEAE